MRKLYIAAALLAEESRYAGMNSKDPGFLRINPEAWKTLQEETPYAPYVDYIRMRFNSSRVILDPSIPKWEFTEEL